MSTETADVVATEPRPLLLSIEAAAKVLSVGRTTFYGLLREGAITAVRIGDRPLIPYSELERYTTDRLAEAAR
jgi:excisionase family DNA binding protein